MQELLKRIIKLSPKGTEVYVIYHVDNIHADLVIDPCEHVSKEVCENYMIKHIEVLGNSYIEDKVLSSNFSKVGNSRGVYRWKIKFDLKMYNRLDRISKIISK